jgi:hypothetical protein
VEFATKFQLVVAKAIRLTSETRFSHVPTTTVAIAAKIFGRSTALAPRDDADAGGRLPMRADARRIACLDLEADAGFVAAAVL